MISRPEILALAQRWMPNPPDADTSRIVTDSTDFFQVQSGDILLLQGHPYWIRNSVREGRFGLDDEVKHWVKRAIDLSSGAMKIIKLVFHEKFEANIGGIVFKCTRSPVKEALILDLVNEHPHFMHGRTLTDEKANPVRILDYIAGVTLADHVADQKQDHESYFHSVMPGVLANFIVCVEAIQFLHAGGQKHGDIRRDHILIDADDGRYRWIDFDYSTESYENIFGYDLFGLGNVLLYIVGKGDVLLQDIERHAPAVLRTIVHDDLNIVVRNRLANLKLVYPYIPESLNRILMHFSRGANWFYEYTHQLISDLREAASRVR